MWFLVQRISCQNYLVDNTTCNRQPTICSINVKFVKQNKITYIVTNQETKIVNLIELQIVYEYTSTFYLYNSRLIKKKHKLCFVLKNDF